MDKWTLRLLDQLDPEGRVGENCNLSFGEWHLRMLKAIHQSDILFYWQSYDLEDEEKKFP